MTAVNPSADARTLADTPRQPLIGGPWRDPEEEIFGPIRGFNDEHEAITAASETDSGLVVYAFTRDLRRALRVTDQLQTGMVGVNQGMVSNPAVPFGGIKQSGFGREGGPEGIQEYLSTKYVAINLD